LPAPTAASPNEEGALLGSLEAIEAAPSSSR
jgi:hypothetical protein